MKKLFLIASLFVCSFTLRAEPAAPLTAESQRAYFKVYDRLVLAMVQQRKDLAPELMKEMSRLGEAGDPRAAFQCAIYHDALKGHEEGRAMAIKLFPELLKLAQKNDWIACQNVAACLLYGLGCKKDSAAAEQWDQKSRELTKTALANDDPVAMLERTFYLLMMGSDTKEAETLLLKLKKHDSKFAEYVLQKLAEEKKRSGK